MLEDDGSPADSDVSDNPSNGRLVAELVSLLQQLLLLGAQIWEQSVPDAEARLDFLRLLYACILSDIDSCCSKIARVLFAHHFHCKVFQFIS